MGDEKAAAKEAAESAWEMREREMHEARMREHEEVAALRKIQKEQIPAEYEDVRRHRRVLEGQGAEMLALQREHVAAYKSEVAHVHAHRARMEELAAKQVEVLAGIATALRARAGLID